MISTDQVKCKIVAVEIAWFWWGGQRFVELVFGSSLDLLGWKNQISSDLTLPDFPPQIAWKQLFSSDLRQIFLVQANFMLAKGGGQIAWSKKIWSRSLENNCFQAIWGGEIFGGQISWKLVFFKLCPGVADIGAYNISYLIVVWHRVLRFWVALLVFVSIC